VKCRRSSVIDNSSYRSALSLAWSLVLDDGLTPRAKFTFASSHDGKYVSSRRVYTAKQGEGKEIRNKDCQKS
jgi:hypothetical protein